MVRAARGGGARSGSAMTILDELAADVGYALLIIGAFLALHLA